MFKFQSTAVAAFISLTVSTPILAQAQKLTEGQKKYPQYICKFDRKKGIVNWSKELGGQASDQQVNAEILALREAYYLEADRFCAGMLGYNQYPENRFGSACNSAKSGSIKHKDKTKHEHDTFNTFHCIRENNPDYKK